MQNTKAIIHGHIVHARIKKYEQEKQAVLRGQEDSPYVIKLKSGVILKPRSRARFSQLCHERYNQIDRALVFMEGRTMNII